MNRSTGASVSACREGERFALRWQGDEEIEVSFPAQGGLLNRPVTFAVAGKRLRFAGFAASMNGRSTEGWRVVGEQSRLEENRVVIVQELQHPDLEAPTKAAFHVWMTPEDKGVRFQVGLEGPGQHLDRLRVGAHDGEGFGCRRLYFGTCVVDGPIRPFEVGRTPDNLPYHHRMRSTNRYWTLELENGLTEMQGMDAVPLGFTFNPEGGVYDMFTTCASPVTYTFVVTSKGGQEAIRQYSRGLPHRPTKALEKLPGRNMVMTWYPIKGHLEWWYREFTGRGARDLVWLAYTNWPDDANRRIVDGSNSLFCPYTNYIDFFDPVAEEGRRASPDWALEHCLFDEPGHLKRGYHQATRLLPHLYPTWARSKKMWTNFFNLTDYRDVMRANAFYFDVHAAVYPAHYFDHEGNHYGQREFLKHTADLFALARAYGGDAPVFSEFGNEWLAEAMDGGAFNAIFGPDRWGIQGRDWEYYPNLDQVHRRHHLSVSVGDHNNYAEKDWGDRKSAFQHRVALNVLFGRSELINCYWPADLRMDTRLLSYYLHSGFHRMLGLNGIREVAFADGNLHRPVVTYDHGAVIRVNLRDEAWVVDGRRLVESCYLIQGPGFLQFCEVPEGKDHCVEFVRSQDYWLFSSPEMHDFGAARISGAYAVRVPTVGCIVVYQIRKTPDVITLHLPDLLGRPGPYVLKGFYTVFDGERVSRVPVSVYNPEPKFEVRRARIDGDDLIFEPSQDPHAWRYEVEIA